MNIEDEQLLAQELMAGLGPENTYTTADSVPIDPAREALVKKICADVQTAKKFWKPKFDRMLRNQRFAYGKQWEEAAPGLSSDDLYTVNIVQRHIQQRTSALYAKNPRFVAKRKDKIDYTVWDGRPDTIDKVIEALNFSVQSGVPPDPNTLAIYEDFVTVARRREMLDRIAKTLELVHQYFIDEQVLPFKKMMKRVVRRAITVGVAYVKLDFQRVMGLRPESEQKIADAAAQLAEIERLSRDLAAGQIEQTSAEAERLRLMIDAIRQEEEVVLREGLVIDYPSSTAIIPDWRCRNLDGFIGCEFVAQEYLLSPERIKAIFDVDVGDRYTAYVPTGDASIAYTPVHGQERPQVGSLACVYQVWNKIEGLEYWVCEGYPNFLREPAAPNVRLERFWPVFTLMFNECDSEDEIFPPSDVDLLRHPQRDYNRARQGLREQRHANRPKSVVPQGRLSEDDKSKLEDHPANAVIELQGMMPGEKVQDLLQPFPHSPIDPALYDTTPQFEDTLRSVGTQEANLGGTSAATATESSIAESSRLSSLQSNVDDLDELLTEIARSAGQIELLEVSAATVQRIVGPGAVWPRMTRAEIVDEIYLDVRAGSSGRPNQAAQIQNIERLAPYLLQIPGLRPTWLGEQMLTRMDDSLDISEAFQPGMPSITAMNSQKQIAMGPPGQDPNAQGPQGVLNAPQPMQSEGDTGRPGRPPMDPNLQLPDQSGIAVN